MQESKNKEADKVVKKVHSRKLAAIIKSTLNKEEKEALIGTYVQMTIMNQVTLFFNEEARRKKLLPFSSRIEKNMKQVINALLDRESKEYQELLDNHDLDVSYLYESVVIASRVMTNLALRDEYHFIYLLEEATKNPQLKKELEELFNKHIDKQEQHEGSN